MDPFISQEIDKGRYYSKKKSFSGRQSATIDLSGTNNDI